MPKRSIAYFKQRFGIGQKPKAEDYADVFDSYIHKDDLAAFNSQEIDQRINNYDTSLRSVTPGGMDTLGDVLKVFQGFPDDWNLKQKLDAAGGQQISWANVTNKPNAVNITWTEQRLFLLDKITVPPGPNTSTYTARSIRDLFVQNQQIAGNIKFVIVDLELQPVLVNWSGSQTPVVVMSVVAATIGVTPKISLQ